LFKAGHGVHSPNTHSDFTGFRPFLASSISSTETSESQSSATLVALVCAYQSVHISCSGWNIVCSFAFFLHGSFDPARDAAKLVSDALEFSSEISVFFGLYVLSLSSSSESCSVFSCSHQIRPLYGSKRQTLCSLCCCFGRPHCHLHRLCILSFKSL
jgi:hypothetical protein